MKKFDLKVTKILNRFHVRLFMDSILLTEMSCSERVDISWVCRELLRDQDKLGNFNEQTEFARSRQKTNPVGNVKFHYRNYDSV